MRDRAQQIRCFARAAADDGMPRRWPRRAQVFVGAEPACRQAGLPPPVFRHAAVLHPFPAAFPLNSARILQQDGIDAKYQSQLRDRGAQSHVHQPRRSLCCNRQKSISTSLFDLPICWSYTTCAILQKIQAVEKPVATQTLPPWAKFCRPSGASISIGGYVGAEASSLGSIVSPLRELCWTRAGLGMRQSQI
jgi:hypothetical protein